MDISQSEIVRMMIFYHDTAVAAVGLARTCSTCLVCRSVLLLHVLAQLGLRHVLVQRAPCHDVEGELLARLVDAIVVAGVAID